MRPEISSEFTILSEVFQLIRHNPLKHGRRVASLYMFSFIAGPEIGNLVRSAYIVTRHIDDVLDGDRKISVDPKQYASTLHEEIRTGNFSNNPISHLAQYTLQRFEQAALPGDNPRQDWTNSIDSMLFDYDRAQEKRVLSQQRLQLYYENTFMPVLNLMLIGIRSRLRAADMPQLAQCMGRVYSILDIQEDWPRGIINIPLEIFESSNLSVDNTVQEVWRNPSVQQWFQQELSESRRDLVTTEAELRCQAEPLTFSVCNERISHMLRVIRKQIGSNF